MDRQKNIDDLVSGTVSLGIELGSTRIKAVLVNGEYSPISTGTFNWESSLVNGAWSYDLADVWLGIKTAYAKLAADVMEKYGITLTKIKSLGISGMMHGYLAFSREGTLLVPFRTWRNTITEQSASILTSELGFNIPQRWSIAHLYQAILNEEEHVGVIDYLTTLSGYVHWKLTGERILGVGDASGMFPIDLEIGDFDRMKVDQFNALLDSYSLNWKLEDILPIVRSAGDQAGQLTKEGANLLDPTGKLEAGVPMAAPEGDAGTGMVATNSVGMRTGNVSAGTSIFSMVVLEEPLKRVHIELDMVTTPAGDPVAMVHCNTGTSELDAWVNLFDETLRLFGVHEVKSAIYKTLYGEALNGEVDAGGLISFNYFSGETITGVEDGRPLLLRRPETSLNVANLFRSHLYSAIATLKLGMDILTVEEKVELDVLTGHGGLFKTEGVAQGILASALNIPVRVMKTAGEGGPWGMAVLSAYLVDRQSGETLEDFLNDKVFVREEANIMEPSKLVHEGFMAFIDKYRACIEVEKEAIRRLI